MSADKVAVKVGCGGGCMGAVIAVCLSWIANKSILWAILHFFCSWFYVIYWIIFRSALYDWLQTIVR